MDGRHEHAHGLAAAFDQHPRPLPARAEADRQGPIEGPRLDARPRPMLRALANEHEAPIREDQGAAHRRGALQDFLRALQGGTDHGSHGIREAVESQRSARGHVCRRCGPARARAVSNSTGRRQLCGHFSDHPRAMRTQGVGDEAGPAVTPAGRPFDRGHPRRPRRPGLPLRDQDPDDRARLGEHAAVRARAGIAPDPAARRHVRLRHLDGAGGRRPRARRSGPSCCS